jgi:hypothetical protein
MRQNISCSIHLYDRQISYSALLTFVRSFVGTGMGVLPIVLGAPEARVFGLFGLWRAGCATGNV